MSSEPNQTSGANAQSFDAKLGKLVASVREMIFIDLDSYPASDDIIGAALINTIHSLCGGSVNRCLGCGIDMGECNPRQYCCKTYCPSQHLSDQDTLE
jgi:hypothetical protein